MVKCSLKFCTRDMKTDMGISFFRFPAESARCDEWMNALGRPDLIGINAEKLHSGKYRVCGVHFSPNSFSSMLLNRLKKTAVPTRFPFQAKPGPYFEGDAEELEKMMSASTESEPVGSNEKQESNEKNDSDEEKRTSTENGKDEQSEMETDSTTKETSDSKVSETTGENSSTSIEADAVQSDDREDGKTAESEVLESEKIGESESKETDPSESTETGHSVNKETDCSESKETEHSESKKTENSEENESEDIENSKSEESNEDKKGDEEISEEAQNEVVQNGVSEENDDKRMDTDENDEDEDYFNPLLLCPDISMDVDESPVLTGSSDLSGANDLSDPNSLFAPLFSTFVDEMTGAEISFNLTSEEQLLREKLYGPNNPIQYTKIHCTACNVHLGSALAGQTNRFAHPLLKVLICKECYHFYTSGEFEKDEDGSELYCRWCGQGGQVLCCTMCEFVFCKKCIRINFGRKKLTQVRDSDDWKCFRCDMSQLKALRAMCVEFFEYIRKEKARALTYTDPDMVNKDLTTCCQAPSRKRPSEQDQEKEAVVKKPKRRRVEEDDPDYDPYKREDDEGSNSSIPSTSGVKASPAPAKPAVAVIKTPTAEASYSAKTPTAVGRIGSTVINKLSSSTANTPRTPTPVTVSRNTAIRSSLQPIRPKTAYTPRTAIPNAIRPVVPQTPVSNAQVRPVASNQRPNFNNRTLMKHEWFEKTVRAAARVNSNLSYTLTQLNKAQSSANSVEQLAVVHNKLQEILSSSINSLIQIRKNLRTEFIAGIKTFRFPPKPAIDPNDDDVIIVNSEPSKSASTKLNPVPKLSPLSRPNKTVQSSAARTYNSNSSTSTSSTSNKGYLKVRSFSQLQNVTSECITIPDDDPPPSPPKPQEPIVVEINEDVQEDNITKVDESEDSSDFKGYASKEDEDKEKEKGKEDENAKDKNSHKTKSKDDENNEESTQNEDEESKNEKEKVESENEKEKDEKENEKGKEEMENEKEKDEKENEKGKEEMGNEKGKEEMANEKGKEEMANEKEKDKKENEKGKEEKENEKEKEGKKSEKEIEEKTEKRKSEKTNGDEKNENKSKTSSETNGDKSSTEDTDKKNGDVNDEVTVKSEPEEDSYNVKDQPSPKIRRMLSVKVNLKKSSGVEDLVKKEPVENGD